MKGIGWTDGKVLGWALSTWVVVGLALIGLGPASSRTALEAGWAAGGVASTLSFACLRWARVRGLPQLLGAMGMGFLARLILLGIALIWALHHGLAPLAFSIGFFVVYLGLQIVELRWVVAGAPRAMPPMGALP